MHTESPTRIRNRRLVFASLGAMLGGNAMFLLSLTAYQLLQFSRQPMSIGCFLTSLIESVSFSLWLVVSFYLLCGALAGYFTARFLEHHDEIEHRKVTQETLEELTMTVAHYVRNANSVIGGHSRLLLDHGQLAEPARSKLQLIRRSSDQIEAVVSSLQSINADVGIEPVGTTRIRMLDIRDLLQEKIRRIDAVTISQR